MSTHSICFLMSTYKCQQFLFFFCFVFCGGGWGSVVVKKSVMSGDMIAMHTDQGLDIIIQNH